MSDKVMVNFRISVQQKHDLFSKADELDITATTLIKFLITNNIKTDMVTKPWIDKINNSLLENG